MNAVSFTDTHCHLADAVFRNNLPQILAQAQECGVRRFIVPASCPQDWQDVADTGNMPSEQNGAAVYTAFGIHPWFADGIEMRHFDHLAVYLQRYPESWVGEIGLDYYDKSQTPAQRSRQQDVFRRQLDMAQHCQRRVIIHNLKASNDIAAIVRQTGFKHGGIVHAFSGSIEEARIFIGLGFKIGIGSLLLNPTAKKVRQTLAALGDGDFVLETDSPFMLKHETNTPANIPKIAEIAAGIRGTDVEKLAATVEKNVDSLLAE